MGTLAFFLSLLVLQVREIAFTSVGHIFFEKMYRGNPCFCMSSLVLKVCEMALILYLVPIFVFLPIFRKKCIVENIPFFFM